MDSDPPPTAGAMRALSYRELPPPRGIEDRVACLWVQHIAPDGVPGRQLAVPNGSAEIACDLSTGEIHVHGPLATTRTTLPVAGQTLIGLRFRPGVATAAVRVSAHETRNADIPLEDCWGAAGALLGEELADADSISSAHRTLLRAVACRLPPQSTADVFAANVVELLQPWRGGTVAAVSRDLFLSERQLRRRTTRLFGFGPKELQRILRFQAFLALVHGLSPDRVELATVAARLGYADQPHLSRECRKLTCLAPRQLLRELSESCAPSHDHSVSFAALRVRFRQDRADVAA